MQGLDVWKSIFIAIVLAVLAFVIGWRMLLALRVLLWGDDTQQDVRVPLRHVAEEMAIQPRVHEAEEMAHLLETLSHRVDAETYRHLVETMPVDIVDRLHTTKV